MTKITLLAAVAALSLGSIAHAAPPTAAPFVLKDANSATQNECTVVYNGNFYPCSMHFGWDYTNNVPGVFGYDAATTGQIVKDPSVVSALQSGVAVTGPLTSTQLATAGLANSANQLGAANFTPSQATVGTTATSIVAARTGRRSLTIVNTGTTPVYLGGSGVTASTGYLLPGVAGASVTISYAGALYGVTASGSAALTEYELY